MKSRKRDLQFETQTTTMLATLTVVAFKAVLKREDVGGDVSDDAEH